MQKKMKKPASLPLLRRAGELLQKFPEIFVAANYINNKNLKKGGSPGKLAKYLEAVLLVYPNNPYMPLFAGLSHVLLGNQELAQNHLEKTKKNLQGSQYWHS